MAINLRCKCGSEARLTAKTCPKCGEAFPKKGRKYKVTLRMDGRKVTRIVTSIELAREIEGKLKVDIARGEHDLQKKRIPTLGDIWKRFEPWARVNKKSFESDLKNYRKHLEPIFAEKKLNQIAPLDIERMVMGMRKAKSLRDRPYAEATIKHQIVLLSRLYSVAFQWGMYDGPNPCKRVRKVRLNNMVTEHFTDEELSRLLAVLDEWPCRMTASIIQFLLSTGLRKGELFRLTWQDVDLDRKIVLLRDPKNGTDQTLPLSDRAIQVLLDVPREIDSHFIFYGLGGKQRQFFARPWARVREAAGLPPTFRLHGLRHHFASAMVSNRVDLLTVSKLLTHKDIATTMRYAHLADQTLRDALVVSDKCQSPKESNVVPLDRVAK